MNYIVHEWAGETSDWQDLIVEFDALGGKYCARLGDWVEALNQLEEKIDPREYPTLVTLLEGPFYEFGEGVTEPRTKDKRFAARETARFEEALMKHGILKREP
jgi:hypothetical protein